MTSRTTDNHDDLTLSEALAEMRALNLKWPTYEELMRERYGDEEYEAMVASGELAPG